MKLRKLLGRIAMSAAALCLSATLSVTSFAANPENLPNNGNGNNGQQQQEQEQGQGQGQQSSGSQGAPSSDSYMTIHFFYLPNSGAGGKMSDQTARKNSTYTLPKCTFSAPAGMEFAGWVTNDYVSQPGSDIHLDNRNDYYLQAIFEETGDFVEVTYDNALSGARNEKRIVRTKRTNDEIKLLDGDIFTPANSDYGFGGWDLGSANGGVYKAGATAKINAKITELTATAKWNSKKDISRCVIDVRNEAYDAADWHVWNFIYNGKPIEPYFVVSLDSRELTKDKDYTVEYSNNINVGSKALITVKGIGAYTGTAKQYFTIKPFDLTKASDGEYKKTYRLNIVADAHTPQNRFYYSGKKNGPDVYVDFSFGKTKYSIPLSDFKISNATAVKAGGYKVKLKAKGENVVNGTLYVPYYIVPAETPKIKSAEKTTWEKATEIRITFEDPKYEKVKIVVSEQKNFNNSTSYIKTINSKTNSLTFCPTVSSKAEYVYLQAYYYVNNATGDPGGTAAVNVKVPKQHITYAGIVSSGSAKGQLRVDFDKITKVLNKVEVQISLSKVFGDDETLSYIVSGTGVSSKFIKLDKIWDNVTKYIRVRYVSDGYYGAWSDVKTVK
ncbi:MAG: hypothetical protein II820_09455 [Ruminiclostridium sp.]|nr:hypothetical protein [Ruminiclostridium sp.]